MTPDQVLELGKSALGGVLSIPVLWYMLRELKVSSKATQRSVIAVGRRLTDLELKLAGDDTRHKLGHLAGDFEKHKADCRGDMRSIDLRVVEMERQIAVIVSQLGCDTNDRRVSS